MEVLNLNEYNSFYQPYVTEVLSINMNLIELLDFSEMQAIGLLQPLTKEQQEYRYAKNKWSVKEILQHLIDTERIFAYRALRFARNDKTNLAGFDENNYVSNSFCDSKGFDKLLIEFKTIRKCSKILFKSFNAVILKNKGLVDGNNMSVRAIGYIISGHQLHHIEIIKERYL